MEDFNCRIRPTWHVTREDESVGLYAMGYCTIQLGLRNKKRTIADLTRALFFMYATLWLTLYFNPSEVHLSSWLKCGSPKAVWSAPSTVVCIESFSCVQWAQRYIYIPRCSWTWTGTKDSKIFSCKVGLHSVAKCGFTYIFTTAFFCCLPNFSIVSIVFCVSYIFIYHHTLIADSKSDMEQVWGDIHVE